MKTTSKAVSGVLVLMLLTSCSSMYIPSMSNTPLLNHKGEKQVEGAISTNSVCISGAYALTDKYAVVVNGNSSFRNYSNYYDLGSKDEVSEPSGSLFVDKDPMGEFSHNYAEVGFGRYNLMDRKWKMEIFGGLGYGNATDKEYRNKYNADYYSGYVQMNYGIRRTHFASGFALRIGASAYDFKYQLDPSEPNFQNGETQSKRFNLVHVEPQAYIKFGGESLKVVCRGGVSLNRQFESLQGIDLDRGISNGSVNTTFLHLSVGLNYCF